MRAVRAEPSLLSGSCVAFLQTFKGFPCPEQKRDAPDTRQRHDGVHNPCPHRRGAAAYPCHDVEAEQPDAAPVQRANDGNNQRDTIHDHGNNQSFPVRHGGRTYGRRKACRLYTRFRRAAEDPYRPPLVCPAAAFLCIALRDALPRGEFLYFCAKRFSFSTFTSG